MNFYRAHSKTLRSRGLRDGSEGLLMTLESIPVAGNLKRIREIWESLENYANRSYFLSWGWIENWITSLPDHIKPELAVYSKGEEPFLAFFLGKTTLTRKHLFKSNAWFVNATGIPEFDRIYIEYNGFLCKHPETLRFTDILKCLPNTWDEFYLPGLDAGFFPGIAELDNTLPCKIIMDDDLLSHFVDLDVVRQRGGDYLSLLSANTRTHIHRSYRLCEQIAPVRFEVACDIRSAMDIYHELVRLHTDRWENRRLEGAFSSNYLFQFHSRLIQRRFNDNEIQLLRIKSGDNTLGCLYNFVYKNSVYFYQSGNNYNLDKRLKPGLLAHVEAIRYNAAIGHKVYDFLGGESRYKMSLATHHNRLIWIRLQKPLLKFRIENALKRFKYLLARRHSDGRWRPGIPG